jgi:hypothetical protein
MMIKHWFLQILEHGTVPAVVLAFAIALTNSEHWQRQDLTNRTKRGIGILFLAPTIGTATWSAKNHKSVLGSSATVGSANGRVDLTTIGRLPLSPINPYKQFRH